MSHKIIFSSLLLFASVIATAANIGYIYPAGVQRGTTVEFLLGGQGLWGVKGVHVTGDGIKVKKFKFLFRPISSEDKVDKTGVIIPIFMI